jgi:uncharacterized repeat protein (TIGR03803 family)
MSSFKTQHLSSAMMTAALFLAITGASSTAQAQTYSLLYQFKAGNDGTQPGAGVTIDPKRQALYGTTGEDGSFASGTVFKLNKYGETVLHSFTGAGGDGEFPFANGSLVVDSAGNLFGATLSGGTYGGVCGDSGCGMVFKVTQSGKESVLYQFQGGLDGNYPEGSIAIDSSGNLYGATSSGGEFGAGVVFTIDPTGQEKTLYSFNSFNGDGQAPYGGVTRDDSGNLYGTTFAGGAAFQGTVFKIAPSGAETILYSFGSQTGDGSEPFAGVSLDPKGNLYGTTYFGGASNFGTVFKVTPNGTETVLHNFGPSPDGESPFVGDGVILDSKGNLYGVAGSGGSSAFGVIYKIDVSGKETILHNFSGPDGKVPEGNLAFDPVGNLYGTANGGGAYGGGVVFRLTP